MILITKKKNYIQSYISARIVLKIKKKKYVVGIYKPNDVDPFSKLLTLIIILQHAIMIGDFFFLNRTSFEMRSCK